MNTFWLKHGNGTDRYMYSPSFWPTLTFQLHPDYLLVESGETMTTLSSALWGGGLRQISRFINGKVPLSYHSDNPEEWVKERLATWGFEEEGTVVLLTAANLERTSVIERVGDQYRLVVCATAGLSNTGRVGKVKSLFSSYLSGTINLFLFLQASLTEAAMINLIMTATEAKCALLQDLGVRTVDGEIATGTTTDSIVLAVQGGKGEEYPHHFAGTATTLGDGVGKAVYAAIKEALAR
ncbi:adenosylcobinamide amidohydrolase [Thermicanus aegyptius]|uniref:adenosylcobinamide amidohydrolase n=1 Tax=Thermicanus aegyptius TaxID=94009 RepID=UPI0004122D17|nr:adenosylcobinamide amidohydrolase [Thermicanus aegyptius]